jgi:hypothetical protein
MAKTKHAKTVAAKALNEPGDEKFEAYDKAVKKGPPLDINVVTTPGGRGLEEALEGQTAVNPKLSGGDVDAAWREAESSGEEAVGGTVATPDQDNVDEIGEAVGLEFEDNQELRGPAEVLEKRDRKRWELNRSSADGDPANQE